MFALTVIRAFLQDGVLRVGRGTCVVRFTSYLSMNAKKQSSYEAAICALNCLQSNSAYLQKVRLENKRNPGLNLTNTTEHLKCLGIKDDDLNGLNIIHVSGTKGKGSTCAFAESILRHSGLKTGFYSSPHVISVNERIRINGKPLHKELFATYFWEVFDTLHGKLGQEKMPTYFMFLTVMSFYVFLKEKVDVAIIEVGIGGLYDCTNVIQKPVVVGVTSLGLDHVQLLGDTISQIAEQKAGIFKPGVPAFSVPQPEGAITVLRKQSEAVGCPFYIVPPFEDYEQEAADSFNFGVIGIVQNLNASLAIQLCHAWLNKRTALNGCISSLFTPSIHVQRELLSPFILPIAPAFSLNSIFRKGLQTCFWPGRFQTVKKDKFTFYLDGAHTVQSIKYCVRWFEEVSEKEKSEISGKVCRLLLFNCTGERKAETLLNPLSEVTFDLAIFSPNRMFEVKDVASDRSNFTVDPDVEMRQCQVNREIWCHLMRSIHENALTASSNGFSNSFVVSYCHQTRYSDPENTRVFTCLDSALRYITEDGSQSESADIFKEVNHYQILVTGSLHLVGGVLSIIKPDVC